MDIESSSIDYSKISIWKGMKRFRDDIDSSQSDKQFVDIVRDQCRIELILNGLGIYPKYNIVDEQKYMWFLLKYVK